MVDEAMTITLLTASQNRENDHPYNGRSVLDDDELEREVRSHDAVAGRPHRPDQCLADLHRRKGRADMIRRAIRAVTDPFSYGAVYARGGSRSLSTRRSGLQVRCPSRPR